MHSFSVDSPLNRLPIPFPSIFPPCPSTTPSYSGPPPGIPPSYSPPPYGISPLSSASSTAACPPTPPPSPSYTTPMLPMEHPTPPPTVQRVSRHSGNMSPLCRKVLARTARRSQPPRHPAKRYRGGRELLVIVTRDVLPTVTLPPLPEEDEEDTTDAEC